MDSNVVCVGTENSTYVVSMKQRILLLFIVSVLAAPGYAASSEKPNFLLILTDDQGWPTLGCYGGKIVPTPNLDRLAAAGARFANAYVTSQCTPTRATLLSGQYTARNRMWHVVGWYGCPWARINEQPFAEQFPRDTPTLASELKRAGYVTGIMGKWHLTTNRDGSYQGLKPAHASHYGFDYAAPLLDKKEFQKGADRGVAKLTEQAIEFISNNREQPWFCYLSHHMIHGNVVAPDEITKKYEDRGFGNDGPNRAVYLAGLECIDRSVGHLMKRLEELGESENTVVIFLSDNGGIDERLAHRNLPKPHPSAPRLEPDMREYDNAPLRAGKGSIYEGGVRVPMIVRWPNSVSPRVIYDPVHAIDIAPTLFGMAGVAPSETHALDGLDLTGLLKTGVDDRLRNRPIYQYTPFYDLNWALTPSASIRIGDYKLIEFFGDRFDASNRYVAGHKVELYNLRTDLGETKDLTHQMPERANVLLNQLHAWMDEMDVARCTENPHYEPARAFETTRKKPAFLSH